MSATAEIELIKALEAEVAYQRGQRLSKLWASLYPWQRRFNAATAAHRACALIAANQVGKCVIGSTEIDTPGGPARIDSIRDGDAVYSWRDGARIEARAKAAISKGLHDCFKLSSQSGEFIGADFHRVLICGHWLFLEELHALYEGRQDRVSALLRSIAEPGLLAHVAGVPHLTGKAQGYPDDCSEYPRQYGEQPHASPESVQSYFPSRADALKRILLWFALCDLARNDKHNLSQFCDHLSNLDDPSQIGVQFVGFLFQAGSRLVGQSSDLLPAIELLDAAASSDPQSIGEFLYRTALELVELGEPLLFSGDESNRIVSCRYIGSNEVFDIEVPGVGNYMAHGFIHHNSRTGVGIDAFHLTGDYPEDWDGHKFGHAPLCWLLGYSGEKTRDLLQTKLFGRLVGQQFEGGLIPADRIVDYKSMSGTSGACREVRVKHASGGTSVCQFWSYSQGQHALMGDVVDWYHIDEEPEDQEIFPQVLTRTLNGDQGRGGRGILTLTPENGKTELVCKFMDNEDAAAEGLYLQTATWDEAPHLSEEAKRQILAAYPEYQRDMRSKGTPLMGSGLIFPVDTATLKVDPFAIPDYWFVINGMDFGWDHPQAHVQLVWNRDADMYYVTNAWKGSKKQPYEAWHIIKPWADGVPTAWPMDGLQTRQQMGAQDAQQQKALYEAEGMVMIGQPATFPDGSVGVWAGITLMLDLMTTGRLKIFSNLFELFEEIREYHTKTTASGNVEIVKLKDDLISALRYALMMRRHAIRIMDIDADPTTMIADTRATAGHYDSF